MAARTRAQLCSLQYILSRLTIHDAVLHTTSGETQSLESFVRSFYPYPQDLGVMAIKYVLEDKDIRVRIEPIYTRAKMLHDQEEIFRTLRMQTILERQHAAVPDHTQPNTLGWRAWVWDEDRKLLRSLVQTEFYREGPELRVEHWDTQDVVRGASGIHACLVPRNWEIANPRHTDMPIGGFDQGRIVTGIVERFGQYVLGTTGWRAEWVIIRRLLAPTQELGFALEIAYPEVEVKYYNHERYGSYL